MFRTNSEMHAIRRRLRDQLLFEMEPYHEEMAELEMDLGSDGTFEEVSDERGNDVLLIECQRQAMLAKQQGESRPSSARATPVVYRRDSYY